MPAREYVYDFAVRRVVAPYKYYLFFLPVIGVGAVFAQIVFI